VTVFSLVGCDRFSESPKPHAGRDDYDAVVGKFGGDEPAVRAELNALATTSSATRDPTDLARANALTRECLDPNVLLDIGEVRSFLEAARRGESVAFRFVSDAHRDRLREIAGDDPSPGRVLDVRRSLARLAAEFEAIRQPPDWSVKVEGDVVPMPFLDLLREGHEFLPAGLHPDLAAGPRIPAFSGAEGELLDQLDRFFNGKRARAAFPPEKFPKLYRNGRIPPIPTALAEYAKEIKDTVSAEKLILLPVANADPDGVEAVDDVYAKLDRFLAAVMHFGK
jgi:hypothetical protein